MIGGVILGQGTYGCAVNPPFLCRGRVRLERKEQQGQKVGKITLNTDAAIEVYIANQIRNIPNWNEYFVVVDNQSCKPMSLGRNSNWKGCSITETVDSKDLTQVTSNFGGQSFSSLGRVNFSTQLDFFYKFFLHLLKAGTLLALNGIIHFDLHRSNVLLDKAGNARIFDFGMGFLESDIRLEVLSERWKLYDPSFDSETPEITVITGVRKGMPLETAIQDVVHKKPVLKECEYIFGVSREQMIRQLSNFFLKSKSFQEKNWVSFFKIYWPVFDSFAIGAILMNVLKVYLTLPAFVDSPRWKQEGPTVLKILQNLLNVDPSERYDCVEALYAYDPKSDVLQNSGAWIAARQAQRKELVQV